MADSDEVYQQQFLRTLFTSTNSDEVEEADSSDSDDDISEHTWIGSNSSNSSTSIIYHLAFLAPGHGDSIWNSSECIAQHLLFPNLRSKIFGDVRKNSGQCCNWPPSRCIEFGAGAALPSLVLLKEGCKRVVFTDRYVNQQTFDALRMSVDKNSTLWGLSEEEVKERVVIMPHTWGEDVERLTQQTTREEGDNDCRGVCEKADLLIASDCIYNPTYHKALLQSVVGAMDKNNGMFIVGYSFHGNVPTSQTLNFFTLAKEEFRLKVVREFKKDYCGQMGIGSEDEKRGAVYVKVLASKESLYYTEDVWKAPSALLERLISNS